MSDQNQLSLRTGSDIALNHYSAEKIRVLKDTVAKGATDTELEMFLSLARHYGLDPFLKEIWFIKRVKKMKYKEYGREWWDYPRLPDGTINYTDAETVIMSSRDGYLKAAKREPDYLGLRSSEVKEGDDFIFDPTTLEIKHRIGTQRGKPVGAWAIAKRENREDVVIYVDFEEYAAAGGNTYSKYPSAMIKKVAEVLALKRQFGLNGLVTQEEMSAEYSLDQSERGPIIEEQLGQGPAEPNGGRAGATNQKGEKQGQNPRQGKAGEDIKRRDWIRLAERVKDLREQQGISADEMKLIAVNVLELSPNPAEWSLKQIRSVKNHLEDRLKATMEDNERGKAIDCSDIINSFEEAEQNKEAN